MARAKPPARTTRAAPAARSRKSPRSRPRLEIPAGTDTVEIRDGARAVKLTNLGKVYFPERKLTKRDLLQYYADVSPWLLPHIRDRAMVMKRYPAGIHGEFFFMKRAPTPRPDWIEVCEIEHASGNVIAFPVIQDLLALLWVVNLGCIDLNPWYARCDDVDRPDFLHFDLDPTPRTSFARVREAALRVHEALRALGLPDVAKTTGASGIHVYVPIERGPVQKEVWTLAKALSTALAKQHPALLTSVYTVRDRPANHVLVDHNQNAWGRTLASIYSVRPEPAASVSTPVTWEEVERGFEVADFRMDNVPARLAGRGDLWAPLLAASGRVRLEDVASRSRGAPPVERGAPRVERGARPAKPRHSRPRRSRPRKAAA